MSLGVGRHRAVAEELAEWWEDVAEGGIGSQVVLVAVPPGWGRSAVLQHFAAAAGGDDGPVTLVVTIAGDLPPGRAVQAQALREALTAFSTEPRVIRLLELDTAAGRVQLGLGLAGLVVTGLAAVASLLVASLTVTAAGNVWDDSPAGEAGGVARAARALARLSVSVPAVVVIDDADRLDVGLALALIRGLAGRRDGQVLVVAAAAPGSGLARALTGEPGYELARRVHRAEADPSMDYPARVELATDLLPGLPFAGAERIARWTATFKEVFAVGGRADWPSWARMPGRLMPLVSWMLSPMLFWSGPGRRRRRWCWRGRAARCTTGRPPGRWRCWVPGDWRMTGGWCGPGRWCGWRARRMGGWPGWSPLCR
jgi:hypothetical protein